MTHDAIWISRYGENEELRASIRSVVANMPYREIRVVGGRPSWYSGDFIPTPQPSRLRPRITKHRATDIAMVALCEDPRVSDRFVYMNDDFFILEPGGPPPPMHRGPIAGVLDHYASIGIQPEADRWLLGMKRTMEKLVELGVPEPLCYELHVPMLIDKGVMREALRHGGQKRSMYGNLAGLGGECIDDVKVYRGGQPIPRGRWLSTNGASWAALEPRMRRLFPHPSPYEAQAEAAS